MKILHLSDLHLHRNNRDNQEAIAVLQSVETRYPNHYIVITGDIVDDGSQAQYENAFELLKQFQGRLFITPGNHDFGCVGNFYSKERAERFDSMLAGPLGQDGTFLAENRPVVNVVKEGNDSVMFIALDTNLETEHPFDFACGEVGEFQLNALSNLLSNPSIPEMKKVLFFHHHPFACNNPFMELKDARKLAQTVFNRVDAILFGHKHEMQKWENRWGVPYILASDDSPGKSSVGEITIEDGRIDADYLTI